VLKAGCFTVGGITKTGPAGLGRGLMGRKEHPPAVHQDKGPPSSNGGGGDVGEQGGPQVVGDCGN